MFGVINSGAAPDFYTHGYFKCSWLKPCSGFKGNRPFPAGLVSCIIQDMYALNDFSPKKSLSVFFYAWYNFIASDSVTG